MNCKHCTRLLTPDNDGGHGYCTSCEYVDEELRGMVTRCAFCQEPLYEDDTFAFVLGHGSTVMRAYCSKECYDAYNQGAFQ